MEGWQSGLMRRSRKPEVCLHTRGFESHSFRHINIWRGRIAGRVQRFAKPPNRATCSEGSNPSLSAILIYGIVLKWLESSLQNCYTSVRIRPMPPNIQKTRMIIRVYFFICFFKKIKLIYKKTFERSHENVC